MMFVFSDIDECASSPCENDATCEDGVNSYTCKCKAGFAGKNCEESKCWYCKRQFRMSSEFEVCETPQHTFSAYQAYDMFTNS